MKNKRPILLSFYALSNGKTNLYQGQLAYSVLNDFSFKEYNWKKTFRTLLNLYRTRTLANKEIKLILDKGTINTKTTHSGAFQCTAPCKEGQHTLETALLESGDEVSIIKDLYPVTIHTMDSPAVVVTDLDDTLLHSFIRNKIKKFRTLMFTTMEKRKAVDDMMHLLKRLVKEKASVCYLSNSEQNLYPLIYRFLQHNEFPEGPIFLKQLRRLTDVVLNRKKPKGEVHKLNTLRQLMKIFKDKRFILIGDNTQKDLLLYLKIAREFPKQVEHIIIRKVYPNKKDQTMIEKAQEDLKKNDIHLYYADTFPKTFKLKESLKPS